MKRRYNWKRGFAALLSGILLLQKPFPAAGAWMSEKEGTGEKQLLSMGNEDGQAEGTITAFEPLDEEEERIVMECKPPLDEIASELGETIRVCLDGAEEPVEIEVSWAAEGKDENSEPGIYRFYPVWEQGRYMVSEFAGTPPEKEVAILDEIYTAPPLSRMLPERTGEIRSVTRDQGYDGSMDTAPLEARFSPLDPETRGLPPLRNQGSFGTCWAFTALGMGELDQYINWETECDLSELHLAYFHFNTVTDPLGGLEGDSNMNISGHSFMDVGSNLDIAYKVLASWTGAAEESTAPYSTARQAMADGLPSGLAYQDVLHLQGAYKIPLEQDRDMAKRLIKEKGGIGVSYFEDLYDGSMDCYNDTYKSYYTPTELTVNHGVLLVGWDDNFPKEHFNVQPQGDGAWLIRNSWGEGELYSHYTYFWISYYDQSLDDLAYLYEYEEADNYDHNYQYDGAVGDSWISNWEQIKSANIFTAHGNAGGKEALKAVSFETNNVNMDYKVEIYRDLTDPGNPESGILVPEATTQGRTTMEGYYTVRLKEEVLLEQGTKFSVVVTFSKSEELVDVVMENSISIMWLRATASYKEGESFIGLGTNWYDTGVRHGTNVRIKAFTDSCETGNPITRLSLSETSKELPRGESFLLRAIPEPSDTDSQIRWESSDSEVATVDHRGEVTAVSAGRAVIRAYADGVSAECEVTVTVPATEIRLDTAQKRLKPGEEFTLTVRVTPEDTDQVIRWTSSAPEVASVDQEGRVTGLGEGTTQIRATAGEVSAVCEVTVEAEETEPEKVPVTAIQLNMEMLELSLGENRLLTAETEPAGATEPVVWITSDSRTAEVDDTGMVRGMDPGTALITAAAGSVSASCRVTVTFPFSDVSVIRGNWKYEGVKYTYINRIMKGISGTDRFEPDAPLTRAMFATVLYRMAGNPSGAGVNRFNDVEKGRWYSDAVLWANEKGIVRGFGDGSYGVNVNITREQIAKMLFEYAKNCSYSIDASGSLSAYTDREQVSGWAADYMRWAVGVGMISGKPNGDGSWRLDPKGEATRAECAAMLTRFEEKYR
ncbi:MAG: Ig-like domain-containing protein [Lachnospiraceae bacterium]|nr:Ig-like domain-containing protein [Lachnospiraceae bacterium]